MSWISEAHGFWHAQQNMGVIDRYATCPLDCEPWQAEDDQWEWENDWETGTVTCGHCGQRLRSIDHVRLCPERD